MEAVCAIPDGADAGRAHEIRAALNGNEQSNGGRQSLYTEKVSCYHRVQNLRKYGVIIIAWIYLENIPFLP